MPEESIDLATSQTSLLPGLEMSKKRRHIPKKVREAVYAKYDGHCAYCGKPIVYKDMHVDHFKPLSFNRGTDDLENLMPSCRRCNYYKDNFMLEGFRKRLEGITNRLRSHSAHKMIYNLALDYGLVKETNNKIKFYFETYKND